MSTSALLSGYLWAALAYVIGTLLWIIFRAASGPITLRSNNFQEVESWLGSFMQKNFTYGMRVSHKNSGRALFFFKYIRFKNFRVTDEFGVKLCVGRSDLSAEQSAQLQALCSEAGLSCDQVEMNSDAMPKELSVIDFGLDVQRAYDFALKIWCDYFELGVDAPNERIEYDDSPLSESVSKDMANLIRSRRIREGLKKTTGLTYARAYLISTIFLILIISMIGLPVAVLASVGDEPAWSIEIGGLKAAGSNASLIWFLTYTASLATTRHILRDVVPRRKSRLEYWTSAGLRFFMFTNPLAVILIWTGV